MLISSIFCEFKMGTTSVTRTQIIDRFKSRWSIYQGYFWRSILQCTLKQMKMSLAEVRNKRMRWSKLKKFKEFKEYIDAWKYFFPYPLGFFLDRMHAEFQPTVFELCTQLLTSIRRNIDWFLKSSRYCYHECSNYIFSLLKEGKGFLNRKS